jgi:hypothetical protein
MSNNQKKKKDYINHSKTCAYTKCNKPFTSNKSHARYCTESCRVRAWLARKSNHLISQTKPKEHLTSSKSELEQKSHLQNIANKDSLKPVADTKPSFQKIRLKSGGIVRILLDSVQLAQTCGYCNEFLIQSKYQRERGCYTGTCPNCARTYVK